MKEKDTTLKQPPSNGETGLVKSENNLQMLQVSRIEDLDEAEAAPIDLVAEYWSPEPGEVKRVIFDRIATTKVLSAINEKELIDLDVCFLVTKEGNEVKQIMNGSKRLVGALQAHNIQHGQGLEIRYLGKQKNKTNGFMSDAWSISPLIKKQS